MLKVLIVDDDSAARTNIKTMIDWLKNGFDICGEAVNGYNAIQVINSNLPDIVITDMSMPVMDGVALIEYLEQNKPGIKIIALSGYDDFDYVRQSMKKGAVDYLLKHTINSEILLTVLNSAREMIYKERHKSALDNQLQEQLTESRTVLRESFIKQLVLGAFNDRKEIEQKISSLGLEIDTSNLSVVVAEIDGFQILKEKFSIKEMNKLISSVLDISNEILRDMGRAVISNIEGGKFVIIFSFGNIRSDLYIHNHIVTAVDRIKLSIKRYLNITACFSVSRVFNDITDISKHYRDADISLQDRFFEGKDKIIREPSQAGIETRFINLDINDEKNIIAALKSINREKLVKYIDNVFINIIERKAGYKSIQMVCAELINIINRVARESGVDVKLVYSDEDIPYNEIKKYETIEEVKDWILKLYEKLMGLMEAVRINPEHSEITKEALKFIRRNYTSNISLNDAADYIGVNSSYLSRVFKEECKIGFVEYLNQIRVEHAKHLIEKGGIKLKDIVKEAGFNNYTYFFKVFKDNINMTPREFEEICRGRQ